MPELADVSRDVLQEMAAAAGARQVEAGSVLVEQGATATHLHVLLRGAAKVVRSPAHGLSDTSILLDVVRAKGLLCAASLFDGRAEAGSIVALRASQVIAVDRRVVLRLALQHPALARALLSHLAMSVHRHVRRLDELAFGPVDDRVRLLLGRLAEEHGTPFGQGRFIAIPLRRRDIACMVHATTETVSRVLARFEREGLTRSTRDGIWLRAAPVPPSRGAAAQGLAEPGVPGGEGAARSGRLPPAPGGQPTLPAGRPTAATE
jgi:CRP-like cAMP-binding protein